MSETPFITTASALIAFHKELIDGGIARELADVMTEDAARHLVREEGLAVRNA